VSFARPDLLSLAVVLPLLLAALLFGFARRRRRAAETLGEAPALARLGGAELRRFPLARLLLITAAGACLGLAAAGPRWGRQVAESQGSALNVVLALDVSKSMLARDVAPSRLERQRLIVRRLLRELGGDRFGLVAFAGRAYVLSPITIDHSAIELYLDALDPGIVSQGGSSLQSALLQATDLTRGVEGAAGDRVVVVMSDGEALEDVEGIRQAAARASSAGVRVFTIGIGTPAGAPVPEVDPGTGEVAGFKRDETGRTVHSRLDADLLRGIAERTGGAYLDVSNGDVVAALAAALGRLERAGVGIEQRTEQRERFGLFLVLALLLLAVDALLAQRRAPRATGLRQWRAAAMVLLVLATAGFGIGELERGNRLYRAGRYAEAVVAYQEALRAGEDSPRLHYNLGTALLQLGRYQEAQRAFGQALTTVDPELRQRALYNLGNRFLLEGRQPGDRQGELLTAAIEAYRQALRIDPADVNAKWNLELALREQAEQEQRQPPPSQSQEEEEPDEPQQGGGGGAQEPASGDEGDAGSAQEERPLSQDQADRILRAAEQDERDLAREKLRRGQRRTPVTRDW